MVDSNVRQFPRRHGDGEVDAERRFAADKRRWLRRVLYDQRCTSLDFRVAAYLIDHISRDGYAWPKQTTIALDLGIARRSVQLSIDQLERSGHVLVSCKRGENHVNRYQFVLSHAQPITLVKFEEAHSDAPVQSARGVTECASSPNNNQRSASSSTKKRILEHEEAQRHSHQEPSLEPIENLTRVGARASADALDAHALAPHDLFLRQRLGPEVYRSWFQQLEVIGVDDGIVTIAAPTTFLCQQVEQRYGDVLLAAWQFEAPDIRAVRVVAASKVLRSAT